MILLPMNGTSALLHARSRQAGIALVVALILLLVVTLFGLAAVGGTLMQQRMSASFYDRQVAFQAAEAAMRQAALAIQANPAAPVGYADCSTAASSGIAANTCQPDPFTDPAMKSIIPTDVTTFSGTLQAARPQYIIQYMGRFPVRRPAVSPTSHASYRRTPTQSSADFYRITARSGDPARIGDRACVVLQSVFRN